MKKKSKEGIKCHVTISVGGKSLTIEPIEVIMERTTHYSVSVLKNGLDRAIDLAKKRMGKNEEAKTNKDCTS